MADSIIEKFAGFLNKTSSTAASCARILMGIPAGKVRRAKSETDGGNSREADGGNSREANGGSNGEPRPMVVLGNGPSLKKNLDEDSDWLRDADTLAVNFFANTPQFRELRPKYYVLADPHFFDKADTDPNVRKLVDNLNTIDFPMTLFIPSKCGKKTRMFNNPNLKIGRFSFTAVEGYLWFEKLAFRAQWGMPRPRNVLIPSLMIGIWLGYKQIYILGADHSWLQTLSVDDENHVVSVQPHFYKEDDKEVQRIQQVYVQHPLHEVIESMMIAFRSYHKIRWYAGIAGTEILNATPDSMIDAFKRAKLPKNA